jgi:hypothetical protein
MPYKKLRMLPEVATAKIGLSGRINSIFKIGIIRPSPMPSIAIIKNKGLAATRKFFLLEACITFFGSPLSFIKYILMPCIDQYHSLFYNRYFN